MIDIKIDSGTLQLLHAGTGDLERIDTLLQRLECEVSCGIRISCRDDYTFIGVSQNGMRAGYGSPCWIQNRSLDLPILRQYGQCSCQNQKDSTTPQT